MTRSDADLHTLTGAYALDALPDDERDEFEAHLAECGACRREVAEFRETASRLAPLAEETPPPDLKDAVMAEVDTIRQDPPSRTVVDLPRARTGWPRTLLAPAAAVLAILVLGLSVILGNVNARLDEVEQTVVAVNDIFTAPDTRVEQVPVDGEGIARVVVSPSRNEGAFFVDGLAETPEDKAYALWLIRGEEATPAGLFTVGEDGRAAQVMTGDMSAVDAIGVTVEPASGSPQPTTDPIVVVEL